MAAFDAHEIDWRCPDVMALLSQNGLISVSLDESEALVAWLRLRGYTIHEIECRNGFSDTLAQLGELFRWEEQFGYRLETGKGNLDALADGFEFPALPGTRVALALSGVDSLADQREWVLGLLSIASDHSSYHLALGSRFITVIPLASDSQLKGAQIGIRIVPIPLALRLP